MGSTALKSANSGQEPVPPWLDTFRSFYEEFPITFRSKRDQFKCPAVRFWKGIGDELLWYSTLTKSGDTLTVIRAFKAALDEYNDQLDKSDKRVRLKGSAWLAGFPITHQEVQLPESSGYDFIGPYIDTGFRLSKFASRMKLVISVDLAWLILNCQTSLADQKDLQLRFDESESLKGVLGGRPYPIIWIECASPLESKEYKLTKAIVQPQEWRASLEDFCSAFIDDTDGALIRPYILGDELVGEPPQSHARWLTHTENDPIEEAVEANGSEPPPAQQEASIEIPALKVRMPQEPDKLQPGLDAIQEAIDSEFNGAI